MNQRALACENSTVGGGRVAVADHEVDCGTLEKPTRETERDEAAVGRG